MALSDSPKKNTNNSNNNLKPNHEHTKHIYTWTGTNQIEIHCISKSNMEWTFGLYCGHGNWFQLPTGIISYVCLLSANVCVVHICFLPFVRVHVQFLPPNSHSVRPTIWIKVPAIWIYILFTILKIDVDSFVCVQRP